MINGIFHTGSGVGNQLHRYVATRILALDKGTDFGMICPENFKATFLKIDMGKAIDVRTKLEMPAGKVVVYDKPIYDVGITYDENIRLANGVIDGEFQDERYFEHRLPEIKEWLKTEPIDTGDYCVINFRGGEYIGVSELFLPQEYWDKAIQYMGVKYPGIKFRCVTDDISTAKKFFPMMPITHDLENDWQSIRWAKHLILSNSSFAILPALISGATEIVAPEFWGGRNVKQWRYPMNKYNKFTYL